MLLEGVPGTAKTLLTQAFAAGFALKFGRIQFTPDLMPGDVLGTNLFNFQTNSFVLTKGPIFTQVLLADEINRTPPKTQAALLQAMNERFVTIDGKDYPLGDEFLVVATQNPIEQQGTYPLPEAQLDRFLFKIVIDYPTRDEEWEIVRRHGHRSAMPRLEDFDLAAVATAADLAFARATVSNIRLSEVLIDYIVDVVRATREHVSITTGASTRAANMLASARAGIRGDARPRFRHPGRCEGARHPADAPSHRPVAQRRNRGARHRPSVARHSGPDGGAAMMMPTARAAFIFAGGVPFALILVAARPDLWGLSFDFGVLVLVAIAIDAAIAFPPRRLTVATKPPARLFVGESGAFAVDIAPSPYVRATRFDIRLEQRGALDESATERLELQPGSRTAVSIALTARRRGRVFVDAVWVRWHGPLSLARFVRRIPVDAVVDVVSNVRGVQNAALQFFSRDAIFGIKVQRQHGDGSEFDALREYTPGLDPRRVDWKRSARHRKLLCKEFDTERNHQIVMAFDTGYLMREPIDKVSRLDHAINAGLVLAWIAMRGGDLVSELRVRCTGCGAISHRRAASPASPTSSERPPSSITTPRKRTSRWGSPNSTSGSSGAHSSSCSPSSSTPSRPSC